MQRISLKYVSELEICLSSSDWDIGWNAILSTLNLTEKTDKDYILSLLLYNCVKIYFSQRSLVGAHDTVQWYNWQ